MRVLQGRDGGIGIFQLKTFADGDDFTCFGGRRWDEDLRRNIRTNSFVNRESSSLLIVTQVSKHSEVSERGLTTTPSAHEPTAADLVRMATPTCSDTK